jgi:hypothetical protein
VRCDAGVHTVPCAVLMPVTRNHVHEWQPLWLPWMHQFVFPEASARPVATNCHLSCHQSIPAVASHACLYSPLAASAVLCAVLLYAVVAFAVVALDVVRSWSDLGGPTVLMMMAHLATTQPHCSSIPLKALQVGTRTKSWSWKILLCSLWHVA